MPTITFKVTPNQQRELRNAARLKRLTVSDYLRAAIPGSEPQPKMKKARYRPGCVVIPAAPDAPLITTDDVKSALYDL